MLNGAAESLCFRTGTRFLGDPTTCLMSCGLVVVIVACFDEKKKPRRQIINYCIVIVSCRDRAIISLMLAWLQLLADSSLAPSNSLPRARHAINTMLPVPTAAHLGGHSSPLAPPPPRPVPPLPALLPLRERQTRPGTAAYRKRRFLKSPSHYSTKLALARLHLADQPTVPDLHLYHSSSWFLDQVTSSASLDKSQRHIYPINTTCVCRHRLGRITSS